MRANSKDSYDSAFPHLVLDATKGGVRAVPQASKSKTSTHTSAKERRTSTFNFRAFLGRLQVGFDIAAKKKSQHANMPFDLSWIGVKKDAMVMF